MVFQKIQKLLVENAKQKAATSEAYRKSHL